MKKIIALSMFFCFNLLFAQNLDSRSMFTNFSLGVLGGTNFNSIPTMGGSLIFEGKSNINDNVFLKISIGYSSLFEDKNYVIKSYNKFKIDNVEGYELDTYDIDQIQYSIIPINIGLEYEFMDGIYSPFGMLEVGYNFHNGEEQIARSSSVGVVDNLSEVPSAHLNSAPGSFNESGMGIGFGIGLNYNLSESFGLTIRYMYRYNESIINSNQILLGIIF